MQNIKTLKIKGEIMKKITLEEKIELITAYAEGKIVDAYDTIFQRWFAKGTDTWDFDREEYRISPNSAPKFKIGDTLVFIGDVNTRDVDTYKIIEIKQGYYRFSDRSLRPVEEVEKEFINIKDVLWYFEIYDYSTKRYSMHPVRRTIPEMDEVFVANHDTLSWESVYSLGFKLKED